MEVIIDGQQYTPSGDHSPTIGVGITTRNRNKIVSNTVQEWRKHMPSNAVLVVVDDASTKPVEHADYRFKENVGIARAKNKCLELLYSAGVQHIFLSDDDIWPVTDNWWKPYVESPEPHLMWMFDRPKGTTKTQLEILYQDNQHTAYHATRGCLLYADRTVLDTVGGMDPGFGKWGWEHVSWSDRIHSAGLTAWRYADITDSLNLFHSMDYENEVESTVDPAAQRFARGPGMELRMESRNSGHYVEFRELSNKVLTVLLTSQDDPQRGKKMAADTSLLKKWHSSLKSGDPVILHTGIEKQNLDAEFVQVSQYINVYFERHLQAYRYLQSHPEVGMVWCTDGTDVEMLRDPFPEMRKGILYIGHEPSTLRNGWLLKNHPDSTLQKFFADHSNKQLLNPGLIGGDRETVMRFLHALIKFWFDDHIDFIFGWETGRAGIGDMGAVQYVAYTQFADILEYGSHINTVFKAEDGTCTTAWWKHK